MSDNQNFDELNEAALSASRSMNGFGSSLNSAAKSTNIMGDAQKAAAKTIKEEEAARKKSAQALKDGAADMAKSIGGIAKSMTSGSSGFTQMNAVIDVTTKAVGGLASAIPIFGTALNAAAQSVGEASKVMVAEFEKGWEAFRGVADSGVVTTFTDLKNVAAATGLRYEQVNATVGKYSSTLARFGGNTLEGTKRLKELADASRATRDDFYRLGINSQEFTEFQLKYIEQQTMTGRIQGKSNRDLADGTKQYIQELDTISKLTGASRKDLQAQRDAALSETKFASAVALLGPEVEKAALGLNDILIKKGGPAIAQGMRDMMSGNITSDAAKTLMLKSGNQAQDIMQKLRDGLIGPVEASNQLQKSIKVNSKQMNEFSQNVGDGNLATRDSAQFNKFANAEELKGMKEIEAARNAVIAGQDTETANLADSSKLLENSSRTMQLLATESKNASVAIKGFADTMNSFTGWAMKTLGGSSAASSSSGSASFGNTGGGAAFGNPNISNQGAAKGASASGLRIKSAEATAGGDSSEALMSLAGQIQSAVGDDLRYFSAFNDAYHQGLDRNSAHKTGKALDFTLRDPKNASKVASMIKSMPGVKNVIDEYAKLSNGGTGGHIHVEVAKTGGIFKGPSSGYPVMLHGEEAVVPADTAVGKRVLNSTGMDAGDSNGQILGDLYSMMSDKLDSVIGLLDDSSSTQRKLLQSTF